MELLDFFHPTEDPCFLIQTAVLLVKVKIKTHMMVHEDNKVETETSCKIMHEW